MEDTDFTHNIYFNYFLCKIRVFRFYLLYYSQSWSEATLGSSEHTIPNRNKIRDKLLRHSLYLQRRSPTLKSKHKKP
jgi:hypothetical protein